MDTNNNFLKTIFLRLIVFGLIACALNIHKYIEYTYPTLLSMIKSKSTITTDWVGDAELNPGEYFLSIGRAQGSCNLFLNNTLILSNEETTLSARSSLVLGSKIIVNKQMKHSFFLTCKNNLGSHIRLIHNPYLNNYRIAQAVHLIRLFTDLFLPLLVIFIVLAFVYISLKEPLFVLPKQALITAFFTTFYLCSLMNIQYLFLNTISSVFIHSICKVGFVFSIISWLLLSKRVSKIIALTALVVGSTFTYLYLFNSENFLPIYTRFVLSIPFIASFFILCLYFIDRVNFNYTVFSSALPFILFSVFDYFAWQSPNGMYLSPSLTIAVFGYAIYDFYKSESAKSAARLAVSTLTGKQLEKLSTTESLTSIAQTLCEILSLSDWTIFVDSYLLGSEIKRKKELRRIGSSESLSRIENTIISLENDKNYGRIMLEALELKNPIIRSGHDGKVFAVIPLGGDCCINLTDRKHSKHSLSYVQTFITESYSQIRSIALTALKFDSTASFSSNLFKEELGIGNHLVEFGAVFADVVGYTYNVNTSKDFVDFFEREYVPSLLRTLNKKVILKDLFGDELFLVILPVQKEMNLSLSIYQATLDVVKLVIDFSKFSGRELCISNGYRPIEFRVGANAGKGEVLVGQSSVGLSGPIIEAKRCQGRARPSEPFITEILANTLTANDKQLLTKEIYAAKKEILIGYRVSHFYEVNNTNDINLKEIKSTKKMA